MTTVLYRSNKLVADKRSTSKATGRHTDTAVKIHLAGSECYYKGSLIRAFGICGTAPSSRVSIEDITNTDNLIEAINIRLLVGMQFPDFRIMLVTDEEVIISDSKDGDVTDVRVSSRSNRVTVGMGSGWSEFRSLGIVRRAILHLMPVKMMVAVISLRDKYTGVETDVLDIN